MGKIEYRNSKILYEGKRVNLLAVEAEHPKGGVTEREIVDHPGAVVVLPLLDPKTVILIRNARYVVQKELWELPAGTLDEGEETLACAKRELQEETGYKAGKMTHLFDFFTTPGFCNEMLYAYLAEDLSYIGQKLDETEKITVEPVNLKTALEMIQKGIICDGKTICTLLYLTQYCKNK
jgi:ADP-ribose pyrophosphatase